ncbi:hypothetical protein J4Q44_G00004060 [Coregonus suidteri]|uniref:Uncharacterized protein n=1 Tax=Coregonus suidteri TaxID=861788 RepID=A0AAN8R8U7_9TELE
MGNIFGRKRRTRVTEQDRAVLQLKQQRDKLKQYQKRITLQLEKERNLAKQLLKDGQWPSQSPDLNPIALEGVEKRVRTCFSHHK